MSLRNPGPLARVTALLLAVPFALVAAAGAQDMTITLPTITAPPGATVQVPITTIPAPAGLGVSSVEFRLDFTPGVVSASASQPDGWLQSWGPAFVNANASFLSAAAAGFPATGSTSGLLNTLSITLSPAATPGTDMPLAFQRILFNEGTPTVAVVPGVIKVRSNAGVGDAVGRHLALAAPSPNPATRAAVLALDVPAGPAADVRIAVFAVDGRLVRELSGGPLAPGPHAIRWDLRDASGAPAAPGLYFATATRGPERVTRRVVVAR